MARLTKKEFAGLICAEAAIFANCTFSMQNADYRFSGMCGGLAVNAIIFWLIFIFASNKRTAGQKVGEAGSKAAGVLQHGVTTNRKSRVIKTTPAKPKKRTSETVS